MPVLAATLLVMLGVDSAYVQIIPGKEDFTDVGPTGNTFDIANLESYKIHPEITRDMLRLAPGDTPITAEFGQAYDELNLIGFGYEDHIPENHVEFLEGLEITVLGKVGDVLEISVHPSQEDRLDQIREQLGVMYPSVDIDVSVSAGLVYLDTIAKASAGNTATPNGAGHPSLTPYPSQNMQVRHGTETVFLNGHD